MKRVLAFLALASCAFAGTWVMTPGKGSHASAAVSYLFNEDFEGTGWPSGWWSGSAADPDDTNSPLAGSQQMRAQLDERGAYTLTSDQGTLYGKFLFRTSALPSTHRIIMNFEDAGYNNLMDIILLSDGTLVCSSGGGSIYETTTAALSTGTLYYIWFYYKKGSGSNAEARIWFDTVDSKPANGSTKSAGNTTGTTTADINHINPGWGLGSVDSFNMDYDNFQGATTDF